MMTEMKSLLIVAVLLIVLSACTNEPVNEVYQVGWVEINSPPGIKGPCYAFFTGNSGYNGYGYYGVWCEKD